MTATQAPVGGQLHILSDKFYEGGQFMPDQDVMAGAKRKAEKAASKFTEFSRPTIGEPVHLGGDIPVSVIPCGWGRAKVVTWAKSQEEAEAMRDTLRNLIEVRLGGRAINWD